MQAYKSIHIDAYLHICAPIDTSTLSYTHASTQPYTQTRLTLQSERATTLVFTCSGKCVVCGEGGEGDGDSEAESEGHVCLSVVRMRRLPILFGYES